MNSNLLALYGLKWNPFSPDLPTEALLAPPAVENFAWRIENCLVREGGFALIEGPVGSGKSGALRLLADRLSNQPDVIVGEFTHPQSNLADFYRELGDLFGIPLKPHNRWGGFKALREKWRAYVESTSLRALLLVDEAQDMSPSVLCELRMLSSMHFDSLVVLAVILAGDGRLRAKLAREELVPLGSRIRCRLNLDLASHEELYDCLKHLLETAGNPNLMTQGLMHTLCEHAIGNYRVLTSMANDLLAAGAHKEVAQLDEKLFLEVFAMQPKRSGKSNKPRKATRA